MVTKLIKFLYWQLWSLKNMNMNIKAFFPISYLSKTHLRKSEIRSNYESPYNTNISLIAAGENPPYIFCCWRTVFRSTSLNKYFFVVFFSSKLSFRSMFFYQLLESGNDVVSIDYAKGRVWNVDFRISFSKEVGFCSHFLGKHHFKVLVKVLVM